MTEPDRAPLDIRLSSPARKRPNRRLGIILGVLALTAAGAAGYDIQENRSPGPRLSQPSTPTPVLQQPPVAPPAPAQPAPVQSQTQAKTHAVQTPPVAPPPAGVPPADLEPDDPYQAARMNTAVQALHMIDAAAQQLSEQTNTDLTISQKLRQKLTAYQAAHPDDPCADATLSVLKEVLNGYKDGVRARTFSFLHEQNLSDLLPTEGRKAPELEADFARWFGTVYEFTRDRVGGRVETLAKDPHSTLAGIGKPAVDYNSFVTGVLQQKSDTFRRQIEQAVGPVDAFHQPAVTSPEVGDLGAGCKITFPVSTPGRKIGFAPIPT